MHGQLVLSDRKSSQNAWRDQDFLAEIKNTFGVGKRPQKRLMGYDSASKSLYPIWELLLSRRGSISIAEFICNVGAIINHPKHDLPLVPVFLERAPMPDSRCRCKVFSESTCVSMKPESNCRPIDRVFNHVARSAVNIAHDSFVLVRGYERR